MPDTLGDRIKRYERAYNGNLVPRSPLFIRIDGKSFHTFTKGCEKPFDWSVIKAMQYATRETASNMQGFKLAYVQSDEATFMLSDTDTHETQGWHDYEIIKVVSVSASLFTGFFNRFWGTYWTTQPITTEQHDENMRKARQIAFFDSRAFTVPIEDAPNVFIWRQRDWERNSIQMLARAHFSHRECHAKNTTQLHELLHTKGVNWSKLNDTEKNGTFIEKDKTATSNRETYETLASRLS